MTFTSPVSPGDSSAEAAGRTVGRKPQFSVDNVVRITLEQGLDRFSVSSVAREPGVTTAAVYRRFPSHRAMLEECVDRILSEIPPLTEETRWQDAIIRAADEWWQLCLRYP